MFYLYICFTHMLKLYVTYVLSASDVCCIQVFHILKVESHGARPGCQGMEHDESLAGGRGTQRTYNPADGACSSSCRLSGPARVERGGGQGEGATGVAFPASAWPSGLAGTEG
jgi:hypothetical protein